jgi:anaerobic selenocysteine-containing dehydrogenase
LEQLASGKPYPIKAAWIQGAGIIPSGFVQPKKVIQLFNSLNLIIIVDIFLNPAAVALADIILPAAMYTEKNSLYVHFSQVGAINQALSPPGECKSDAEIILSVGKKIASEYFPWKNVLEWIDYRLQPGGIDFAELRMVSALKPSVSYARFAEGLLRSDKKTGFQTPSAKIELFSQVLKNCNLNPLPYYESSFEYKDKQQNQDYPYILTTGVRKPYFFCMEWRNSPSLRHYQSDPEVCINPEDAKLREISNGDWIKIYTPYGKCQMKARVCNRFPVGVIHCDSGWWFPEKKPERLFDIGSCNVNALFPLGLTGSSGLGFPFRSYFCNIEKSIS